MADDPDFHIPPLVSSGIAGLDEVLNGGLVADRLYLLEGQPGSGKTTLALQFLLDGVRRGERCLYVTLSETAQELRTAAGSHGWSLDGIRILEILTAQDRLMPESRYTMFHPSEVELAETTKAILAAAEEIQPARMVLDSLSELRLLAENPLRYRRQILALRQHLAGQRCTVMFIDDRQGDFPDMCLHSLAHGVISLERVTPEYGRSRRRLEVPKLRARQIRDGFHDFEIRTGGLEVFPRLVAGDQAQPFAPGVIESGLPALDALLGGGLAKGTSTLVVGAAGTGKSSLSALYAVAAAGRGEPASFFLFDESVPTWVERSRGLGLPVQNLMESGRLTIRQIHPAETSPGEFTEAVRRAVQDGGSRMVVIDSLSGYLNAMPSERLLMLHLHELLSFLGRQGVSTLLLIAQHGLAARDAQASLDASYLVDCIVLLRYFEAFGEIRRAISVIKKRTGRHERTIREMRFRGGLTIGEPLREFQGVLAGVPEFVGSSVHPARADGNAPHLD